LGRALARPNIYTRCKKSNETNREWFLANP
jgi:hypothetical protein